MEISRSLAIAVFVAGICPFSVWAGWNGPDLEQIKAAQKAAAIRTDEAETATPSRSDVPCESKVEPAVSVRPGSYQDRGPYR